MRYLRVLFAVAAVAALTAAAADARPMTPRVDRREARQHERIVQGVRSGELTPGEAARLRTGQAHIRRMERRDKSDGVVTLRERGELRRAQNRQSRHIWRMKHNGRAC
jgi:hypothetical protein